MKKLGFWMMLMILYVLYENRKDIKLKFEKVTYEVVKEEK